jgi:hypothetical protein
VVAFFQSFPDLQPLYDAARSYLEIPQRINLLNTRVEVGLSHVMTSLVIENQKFVGFAGYAPAFEGDGVEQTLRTPRTDRHCSDWD